MTNQKLQREYEDLLADKLRLTKKIAKLQRGDGGRGSRDEANALDAESWEIHRRLEEIGIALGKSKHAVQSDIILSSYERELRTTLPGMAVVPVAGKAKVEKVKIGAGGTKRSLHQDYETSRVTTDALVGQWKIDQKQWPERLPTEGFLLIYNMTHKDTSAYSDTKIVSRDLAADLKKKRVKSLIQALREQGVGESKVNDMRWAENHGYGVAHDYNAIEYEALFVAEPYLDRVLKLVESDPEAYWISEKEFKELAQKYRRDTVIEIDLITDKSLQDRDDAAPLDRQLQDVMWQRSEGSKRRIVTDERLDDVPHIDLARHLHDSVLDALKNLISQDGSRSPQVYALLDKMRKAIADDKSYEMIEYLHVIKSEVYDYSGKLIQADPGVLSRPRLEGEIEGVQFDSEYGEDMATRYVPVGKEDLERAILALKSLSEAKRELHIEHREGDGGMARKK